MRLFLHSFFPYLVAWLLRRDYNINPISVNSIIIFNSEHACGGRDLGGVMAGDISQKRKYLIPEALAVGKRTTQKHVPGMYNGVHVATGLTTWQVQNMRPY